MKLSKNQLETFSSYGLLDFNLHVTQKGCSRNHVGSYKKYQKITTENIDDFMMTLAYNQDLVRSKDEIIEEVTGEQLLKNLHNLIRKDCFARAIKQVYIYKYKQGFRLKSENVMSYQLYASKVRLVEINEQLVVGELNNKKPKQNLQQPLLQDIWMKNNSKKIFENQLLNQQFIGIIDPNLYNSSNEVDSLQKKVKQNQQIEKVEYGEQLSQSNKCSQSEDKQDQKLQQLLLEIQQPSEEVVYEEQDKSMECDGQEVEQSIDLQNERVSSFDQTLLSNKTSLYYNQNNINKTFLMSIKKYQHLMNEKLKKGYQTYYNLKQKTNELHLIYISIFTLDDDDNVPNPDWASFKNHLIQAIQSKFSFDNPLNYYYCKIGYTKNIERVDIHFKNYNAKFYKAFLCYREREEYQFHTSTDAQQFKIPVNYPHPYEGKGEIYVFHPLLEWLLQQQFKKYKALIL